jgi:hypothetical protein
MRWPTAGIAGTGRTTARGACSCWFPWQASETVLPGKRPGRSMGQTKPATKSWMARKRAANPIRHMVASATSTSRGEAAARISEFRVNPCKPSRATRHATLSVRRPRAWDRQCRGVAFACEHSCQENGPRNGGPCKRTAPVGGGERAALHRIVNVSGKFCSTRGKGHLYQVVSRDRVCKGKLTVLAAGSTLLQNYNRGRRQATSGWRRHG